MDGSAPPTRCVCDAWGDAFPDAPPGKRLDTGAISSSGFFILLTYDAFKLACIYRDGSGAELDESE